MNVSDSARRRSDSKGSGRSHEDDAEQTNVLETNLKTMNEDKFVSLSVISDDDISPLTDEARGTPLRDAQRTVPISTDLLKCPKCGEEHKPECHANFLEHIELCCD